MQGGGLPITASSPSPQHAALLDVGTGAWAPAQRHPTPRESPHRSESHAGTSLDPVEEILSASGRELFPPERGGSPLDLFEREGNKERSDVMSDRPDSTSHSMYLGGWVRKSLLR
jgi:hypothetical protein